MERIAGESERLNETNSLFVVTDALCIAVTLTLMSEKPDRLSSCPHH